MRNVLLLSFVCMLAMGFTSCDSLLGAAEDLNPNRVEISLNDLPPVVTNYIAANYPEEVIESAATNLNDEGRMFYEVFTQNGLELEFDLEGVFLGEDESDDDCGWGDNDRCGNG